MKILAVGGGSGGHVTPVVAVLRELRQRHPQAIIRFWCDRRFAPQARSLMHDFDSTMPVQVIMAGKLRRYHHLTVWQQLTWPSLVFKNTGDGFLVLIGIIQSLFKLIVWRPDVVFTKGGYVCLPVGIAAKLLHIPLVIHDSDAYPGLTNRILARWAVAIATGAPLEYYAYPKDKSRYVGIPIASDFRSFSADERKAARELWGFAPDKPLVVITGGGLGAQRINVVVAEILPTLLKRASVLLIAGASQYDDVRPIVPPNDTHFQLHSFVSHDQAQLFAAADVVITRAGMTTILELAALSRPVILIPNGKLTGGHQLKNAAVYSEKDAVIVLDEDELDTSPGLLLAAVDDILDNPDVALAMAKRLHAFARPEAAKDVVDMIISTAKTV